MQQDEFGFLALAIAESLAMLASSRDLTAQGEVLTALSDLSERLRATSPQMLPRLEALMSAVRHAPLPEARDFIG
ncbi:hypothetical protein [Roseomonas populi]|uniref:Uncharacterized protein n=1 Tax=Roseomonas populi TaxID=3121582 RepID=A0ABT1X9P8_9PROT|nr:hypothetical protein [Roseomonas pecuniae]MCR0984830.1 hypothetical protein [Roseomonas pecuniae]